MARKLKTYVTSIGFFEEAVAAPSMKAALEAWGSDRNLFSQGFAKETTDASIIAATMKQPGVVLKRPVGSGGAFKIRAELPKNFVDKQPAAAVAKTETKPVKGNLAKADKKTLEREQKAAEAYKREEKRREQQRQKEEAIRKKLREKREAVRAKAELGLKKAEAAYEQKMQSLMDQQTAINEKIEAEEMNWDNEKRRLQAAIDKL